MAKNKKDRRHESAGSEARPEVERRAPDGKPGVLRRLRAVLTRPLGLVERQGKRHIALVERRRPPEMIEAAERKALCDELGLRLVENGDVQARVMRALVEVHDTLRTGGWPAIEPLTSVLLARAHEQARMLLDRGATPRLRFLVEKLLMLQVAAQVREERAVEAQRAARVAQAAAAAARPEDDERSLLDPVSSLPPMELANASPEDYEEAERSWFVPDVPEPRSGDKPKA